MHLAMGCSCVRSQFSPCLMSVVMKRESAARGTKNAMSTGVGCFHASATVDMDGTRYKRLLVGGYTMRVSARSATIHAAKGSTRRAFWSAHAKICAEFVELGGTVNMEAEMFADTAT